MAEALVGRSEEQSPSEAETLLAIGFLMEAANLPHFLIFRDIKKITYLQSASFSLTFQK